MTDAPRPDYFQDHMIGNVCFGCGSHNPDGLQIKSWWEGDESVTRWQPQHRYRGWPHVLNGGILATLVDCHCMDTAMAAAYRAEGRALDSHPYYRYATGTLSVKYLKPTSMHHPVELRARVIEIKGRKTTVHCDVFSNGEKTAEATVIGIRVVEGEPLGDNSPFAE